MNQHHHDDVVVAALRAGLAATEPPQVAPGEAAAAARRARQSVARRHQRTVVATAAAAVVLVGGGIAALGVASGNTSPADIQAAAGPVTGWPARGALAGDTALTEQARSTWTRAHPEAASSGTQPDLLYAGSITEAAGWHATLVVLRSRTADGQTSLGFLTTTLSTGTPDNATLLLRAQVPVPENAADAAGYGFVASHPVAGDAAPKAPVSLAVALTASGTTDARFTTSAVDQELADTTSHPVDGLVTAALPPQAAAWNTQLALGARGDRTVALASAATDPATLPVTATPHQDGTFTVTGADARPGDLLAVHEGLIGVVTTGGTTATAGPAPAALASSGLHARTAVTDLPVTLTAAGDRVTVTAQPGVLREGNRIMANGFPGSAAILNLGTVHPGPAGTWVLRQDGWIPASAGPAMLVRHP